MRDNRYIVDGRKRHERRAARPRRRRGEKLETREVEAESAEIGVVCKADLLVQEGRAPAVLVEYKRGRAPDPERHNCTCWPNDEIQVGAQALCLVEAGTDLAATARIIYASNNKTIEVSLDSALFVRVREAVAAARELASQATPPPPLDDSTRCDACSLMPVCIPEKSGGAGGVVPKLTLKDTVYVDTQGAYLNRVKDHLVVRLQGEKETTIPLNDLAQLVLLGRVEISTPAVHALAEKGIPTMLLNAYGRFIAAVQPAPAKNIELRRRQFAQTAEPDARLRLARKWIAAKLRNSRTLLRRFARNHPEHAEPLDAATDELKRLERQAERATTLDRLLGLEGNAARVYYACWPKLLRQELFDWTARSRRPPRDPVNAVLSFAYTLLTKDAFAAAMVAALDPYCGAFHADRFGRPALALDLMEPFRPVVADSVALSLVNNRRIAAGDFTQTKHACLLNRSGRRALMQEYEARMADEIEHPVTKHKLALRRCLELDARLLAAWFRGDKPDYKPFRWR